MFFFFTEIIIDLIIRGVYTPHTYIIMYAVVIKISKIRNSFLNKRVKLFNLFYAIHPVTEKLNLS